MKKNYILTNDKRIPFVSYETRFKYDSYGKNVCCICKCDKNGYYVEINNPGEKIILCNDCFSRNAIKRFHFFTRKRSLQ
jgi:hypothetical protein